MLTLHVVDLQPLFCFGSQNRGLTPQWQGTKHLVLHVKKESSASAQWAVMFNFPVKMLTHEAQVRVGLWMCERMHAFKGVRSCRDIVVWHDRFLSQLREFLGSGLTVLTIEQSQSASLLLTESPFRLLSQAEHIQWLWMEVMHHHFSPTIVWNTMTF